MACNGPEIEQHHEGHQREQEEHAGIGKADDHSLAGRFAAEAFVNQENHVAAIEHRDRQEVDHGQICAEQGKKQQKLGQTLLLLRTRRFG